MAGALGVPVDVLRHYCDAITGFHPPPCLRRPAGPTPCTQVPGGFLDVGGVAGGRPHPVGNCEKQG